MGVQNRKIVDLPLELCEILKFKSWVLFWFGLLAFHYARVSLGNPEHFVSYRTCFLYIIYIYALLLFLWMKCSTNFKDFFSFTYICIFWYKKTNTYIWNNFSSFTELNVRESDVRVCDESSCKYGGVCKEDGDGLKCACQFQVRKPNPILKSFYIPHVL